MSIELRFYRQRFNMDKDYYSGEDDVYLTLYYPNIEALEDDWDNLINKKTGGYWLEGETYSAWDDDDDMICGGAFDPDDIEIIKEHFE